MSSLEAGVDACWLRLSADEQRAFRSLPEAVRDQKALVRGCLRTVLAGYLGDDPKQVRFSTGLYGKPLLVGHDLQFNISHSGDWLVIAVANVSTVGVDVECVKPRASLDQVARRCFSETEYRHWRALPVDQQLRCFYRLWTIKEAFVKAVGRGLALGLSACEVDCVEFDRLLGVPDDCGGAADDWAVKTLPMDEAVVGAVVVPSGDCLLRLYPIKKPQ